MIRRLLSLSVMAAFAIAATAKADDKDKAKEREAALSKLVQLGPGVHAINKDKQGRILTFMVVGQARISTALGKAKGLEVARDKAKLNASAELVKWLNEKVSVHQKSEEEVILFLEGSEDNDKDALKESGKAIEKSTKKIESLASGLIRGLQVLHTDTNGTDKTFTVVLGWDADTAEAVKKVKAVNESDTPTKKDDDKKTDDDGKKTDKKIDDKKATSPDADKFLPKN